MNYMPIYEFHAPTESSCKPIESSEPILTPGYKLDLGFVDMMIRTWHLRIRTMIIRCAHSYICIVALVIIHLVLHVHVTI
jgi:hypothetical protein